LKYSIECPTFSVISLASDGNINAIEKILKHYDAYLSKSSLRPLYDEYGQMYIAVDTELKGLIRTALVARILKFEIEVV